MAFPWNPQLGPIVFPTHAVLEITSFVVGYQIYRRLRKRDGDALTSDNRVWILIGAGVGAFIGSRLIAGLERPDLFFGPSSIVYYLASKTVVGGLLGGVIGVELAKKLIHESRSSGDLFTLPIISAMIVGRIGCFLTGVADRTVGVSSTLPWAFDQGDGIPRHPTSLYEILALLGLAATVSLLRRRYTMAPGMQFKIFMLGYLAFRLLVEFIKPRTPLGLGLSSIQWACIAGLLYYIAVLAPQLRSHHE